MKKSRFSEEQIAYALRMVGGVGNWRLDLPLRNCLSTVKWKGQYSSDKKAPAGLIGRGSHFSVCARS
ncbi:hypothetical protein KIH07_17295 [Hydrogenophaga taeniospiralis]|jgi:hypothetical protein|uniref:hypothetical protein n=1 Tax=Hydrogenophaga taeniospiralis TaxID=65656 RepID=UPI001CFC2493|nr:hypothetical protein [Hydrogenophaga taeniospiralis]MCB4365499.1 hypothetical protein [Hydrogenophaga taeniospiralis]